MMLNTMDWNPKLIGFFVHPTKRLGFHVKTRGKDQKLCRRLISRQAKRFQV